MYKFSIADNGHKLEIVITRTILALAGCVCFLYRGEDHILLNITAGVSLLLIAVFIRSILVLFKINQVILVILSSLIVLAGTGVILFALLLLLYGILSKKIYKNSSIEISMEGVQIFKAFSSPIYLWADFNNIVFKDELLTLDFKSNKVLQLVVNEENNVLNEIEFNDYCRQNIDQGNQVITRETPT